MVRKFAVENPPRSFTRELLKSRFKVFSQDGKLAVLDFNTRKVHVGSDINDVFDETGTLYIDPGVRLPNAEPIARTWEEVKERLATQFRDQLSQLSFGGRGGQLAHVEVVFPPSHRTPEEELERANRLIREALVGPQPELTVGDLSAHTAKKREDARRWARNPANAQQGMTVGNLTHLASDTAHPDAPHFTDKPVHCWPETESDKLLEKKYEQDAKAADMRFLVENPSELQKRALEMGPKIRKSLGDAREKQDEMRREEAWRQVEEQLRAKGIKI